MPNPFFSDDAPSLDLGYIEQRARKAKSRDWAAPEEVIALVDRVRKLEAELLASRELSIVAYLTGNIAAYAAESKRILGVAALARLDDETCLDDDVESIRVRVRRFLEEAGA